MDLLEYEKFIVNVLQPQEVDLTQQLSRVSTEAEGCRTLAASLRSEDNSSVLMAEICKGCFAEVELDEGGELMVSLGLSDTMVAMSNSEAMGFLEARGLLLGRRQELLEFKLDKVKRDIVEATSVVRQLYVLRGVSCRAPS